MKIHNLTETQQDDVWSVIYQNLKDIHEVGTNASCEGKLHKFNVHGRWLGMIPEYYYTVYSLLQQQNLALLQTERCDCDPPLNNYEPLHPDKNHITVTLLPAGIELLQSTSRLPTSIL